MEKPPPDMQEDGRNQVVGGETSDIDGGFRMRNGFRERLAMKSKGGGYHRC